MAPTKLHGITFYNVLSMQGFQRTKRGRLCDPAKIQNGSDGGPGWTRTSDPALIK
ncbi:uncharacterized protein METZ01_LOCUS408116, partial [marine metagenome]